MANDPGGVTPDDRPRTRRAWKRVAIVVVAAFAAVFVAQHREDVPEAWTVVRTASVWWRTGQLSLGRLVNTG
jgi:hypothetical protein